MTATWTLVGLMIIFMLIIGRGLSIALAVAFVVLVFGSLFVAEVRSQRRY